MAQEQGLDDRIALTAEKIQIVRYITIHLR